MAANPRSIVVRVKGDAGGLKIINEFNAACDPLHFVLLFPRGELGSGCFLGGGGAAHPGGPWVGGHLPLFYWSFLT